MYTRRKYNRNVQSLLHFDFPYYAEPGDGLRDEVSSESWTRSGNVKFVGTEAPNDEVISGCPKFGYRCPSFAGASQLIVGTNSSGIWNFQSTGNYEIEFFLRITSASSNANIFALKNSAGAICMSVTHDTNLHVGVTFGTNSMLTSSFTVALNTWTHILIRINANRMTLYFNGAQVTSTELNAQTLNVSRVELGGFTGQLDEFIMRHSAISTVNVPTEPYKGILEINSVGGFGNARHGNVTITANTQINTYAMLTTSSKNVTLNTSGFSVGRFGTPTVGDEIMILVTAPRGSKYDDLGCYAFRTITATNGNTLTINKAITEEFNLNSIAANYYIQVITVPNFNNLTLNAGITIRPLNYSTSYGGGIIIFRANNTATINGALTSFAYGPNRADLRQVCNANLVDAFIMNKGGGVYVLAKNFKTSNSARIGATWDGSAKAGTAQRAKNGTNGGTGYGGGGAGDADQSGTGSPGAVGGGGGGGNGATAYTIGSHKTTGGHGNDYGVNTVGDGGTQGVTSGAVGFTSRGGSSGGGAGGNSGFCTYDNNSVAYAGANVIIIAENFSADMSSISTGGQGGISGGGATGGGGTGFCYIAAKELK